MISTVTADVSNDEKFTVEVVRGFYCQKSILTIDGYHGQLLIFVRDDQLQHIAETIQRYLADAGQSESHVPVALQNV